MVIKFQGFRRPEAGRKLQGIKRRPGEYPLIGQVVNREDAGRPFGFIGQERRDEPGLPVIAVNNVRFKVEPKTIERDFYADPAEMRKALGVVRPRRPIRTEIGVSLTTEVTFIHDGPDRNVRSWKRCGHQARGILRGGRQGVEGG